MNWGGRPRRSRSSMWSMRCSPLERIRRCPLGLRSHTRLCPLHAELDQVYASAEKCFREYRLRNYFILRVRSYHFAKWAEGAALAFMDT